MGNQNNIRERILLQAFVIAGWLVIFGLGSFSRVQMDLWSFSGLFQLAGYCYLISFACALIRDTYLRPIFEILGAGFLLTIPILYSTYLALSIDMPLADPQLIAMDEALGFNWRLFIEFVDQSQTLSSVLANAYASFGFQIFMTPILLAIWKNVPRAAGYIFGYSLLCFVSSIVAIWFPAIGTYGMYDVDPASLLNIDAHFGFHFLKDFNQLREGGEFVISQSNASGILTFPSVHAGVAFFTLWACWENKWLRWPFTILNLAMVVSAISHANHYLVDVIAGLGIAAITASIVGYLFLGYRLRFADMKIKSKPLTASHTPQG